MRKRIVIVLLLMSAFKLNAQVDNDTIDLKYLEDQIYISLSYNIINDKPKSDYSSLFSGGLTFGFIKDLPFNKRRNIGMGVGLGYSFNSYNNKMPQFINSSGKIQAAGENSRNRFKTYLIEFPVEIRWRTSTPTKYSFWRVYGGIKFAYLFYSKFNLESELASFTVKKINAFNKFQYGLTLSAGYSNWNLYIYYSLNPIFKEVFINGDQLNIKDFSVGLKFYIL